MQVITMLFTFRETIRVYNDENRWNLENETSITDHAPNPSQN